MAPVLLGNAAIESDRAAVRSTRAAMLRGRTATVLSKAASAFILGLPSMIATGVIAFAPLGAAAAAAGVTAALLGGAIGILICTVLSGTRGVVVGPTSGIALVTGSVFAALLQRGELSPDDPVSALAVLLLLGLLTAVFQLAMAVVQMGRLMTLLPYPVIAGLVNGTAALLLVSQVPMALGLPMGDGPRTGAALVAAATFGLALLRWPWSLPAPVCALLAGASLHHAMDAWAPGLKLGAVIGTMEPLALHAAMLADGYANIAHIPLQSVFRIVVPAALSIALLSSILMMASVAAIRDAGGAHGGSRRDMLAIGTCNLGAGAAGGLACAGILSSTVPLWRAGGRGAIAPVLMGLMLLGLMLLPVSVLSQLPVSALAGLVAVVGLRMIDLDVFRLIRRLPGSAPRQRADILGGVATVLLMIALALGFGLVAAVAAGLVLALLVFASVMAHGLIRRSYASPPGRSRIRRGAQENATLAERPEAIRVVEVEGAVFFGNAEGVGQAVDRALAEGAVHVLLDMRRVGRIDLSGARRLVLLCERNWQAGVALVVTPLRQGHAVHDSLEQFGLLGRLPGGGVAETLEAGLALAEAALLAGMTAPPRQGLEPAEGLTALGLPVDAVAALLAVATEVALPDGAALLRAGAPADAVYLLLRGALDINMPRAGHPALYLGRLMPGALVGEMALISGAPRSADVMAHGPVACLCLDGAAIADLREREPAVAYALLSAMARQLERNLRYANAATAALEE